MERLSLRMLPRHMRASRRSSAYRPATPAVVSPRRWGRLLVLTLGVTAVGIVAGATLAAPDQMVPLAGAAADRVARASGPWLIAGRQALTTTSGTVVEYLRTERSPREWGMLAAGSLSLLLAFGAGWMRWRSPRSARAVAGRQATAPGLPSALVAPARRGSGSATPKQVRALVERGASLSEIAQRTGLPMDAVALLLAVSDPSRQLPPRTA
jgi:hypothetical protein